MKSFLFAPLLLLAVPAWADGPPADPDWPCIQRKVGTISPGMVWNGPDLAAAGPWDQDFKAAELAQKLASRRTPIEDADGLIDAFAAEAGAEKQLRLTRVFAGVLELVNTERDRVIAGITRYARGQSHLAERIRDESDKVSDAKDAPNAPVSDEIRQLEDQLKWDTRIFEERRKSLTYVCETPQILERRAFEIARRIQDKL
ncbi:hypothetical protein [Zavarzinia sp.]|uniref:hypothetical protein n=1 Tax=Zavarzinia sp. TaxID=2027920 RepID=UPI003564217E